MIFQAAPRALRSPLARVSSKLVGWFPVALMALSCTVMSPSAEALMGKGTSWKTPTSGTYGPPDVGAPVSERAGTVLVGDLAVRGAVPVAAPVEAFRNDGYELVVGTPSSEQRRAGLVPIEVKVDLSAKPSTAKFRHSQNPDLIGKSPVELVRLAESLTVREEHLEGAVLAVLNWLSRNIEYQLDRSQPQDSLSVLERRSGYCTGIAALAQALVQAAGIEAREVAGYVLPSDNSTPQDSKHEVVQRAGYHRWIEIYFPDTGWRFADPVATLNFVPATYVRLASRLVPAPESRDWRVHAQVDRTWPIAADYALPFGIVRAARGQAPSGTSLRVTFEMQGSGTAKDVAPWPPGLEVDLIGPSWIRTRKPLGNRADFVGLGPGQYALTWRWRAPASHASGGSGGQSVYESSRTLELHDPGLFEVQVRLDHPLGAVEARPNWP